MGLAGIDQKQIEINDNNIAFYENKIVIDNTKLFQQ